MRTLMVALLAAVLSPSLAQAGGSKLATLVVKNDNSPSSTVELLAVILDTDPGSFSESFDLAGFLAAGGRLVGPKGSAVFPNLRIGTHTVYAVYVPIGTLDFGSLQASSATVNVQRGTTTVRVRGSSTSGATIITPSSTP